jgi:hypothetical protein
MWTLVSFYEGNLVGMTRAFDLPGPTLCADEFVDKSTGTRKQRTNDVIIKEGDETEHAYIINGEDEVFDAMAVSQNEFF